MRQILIVVVAVAFSAVIVKAEGNGTDPKPASGQPKFDNVDWELSKVMGINKQYENVVISPTSLRVVLGLLLDAANGATADEIAKFLRIGAEQLTDKAKIRKHYNELIKSLNRPPDATLTSDVVTRIFADDSASLNKTYLKIVKDNYDTEVEVVDFSNLSDVITKINKWAEGATHGHIKDLLSEADTSSEADMLLLNVIFFSGLWTNPFDETKTTNESFYLNNNKYITVPMMKAQYELEYSQTYDSELQLLRMPYQGGSFAMYFILPRSRNGLDDLIENVTPAKVHSLMKTLAPTTVNITIPRFKFSYNIGMKPILEKLGIKKMFTQEADLSNLENHNSKSLYVANVLQKAGIEVNEKGSTAYASTVAEIHNKFGGETTEFRADRPFLFFIEEDKTRTVVFVGKVSNPGTFLTSTGQSKG